MSKEKKARKARKPNVPLYTGPGMGGGGSVTIETASAGAVRAPVKAETIQADYGYVVADLKRIGLLAGVLIAALVILSFFIK